VNNGWTVVTPTAGAGLFPAMQGFGAVYDSTNDLIYVVVGSSSAYDTVGKVLLFTWSTTTWSAPTGIPAFSNRLRGCMWMHSGTNTFFRLFVCGDAFWPLVCAPLLFPPSIIILKKLLNYHHHHHHHHLFTTAFMFVCCVYLAGYLIRPHTSC
jgi:hypothetical protein